MHPLGVSHWLQKCLGGEFGVPSLRLNFFLDFFSFSKYCVNTKFHSLDLQTGNHMVISWFIHHRLFALESVLSKKLYKKLFSVQEDKQSN